MKFLTEIPYRDVKFLWIEDHWDIHKCGLCYFNNSLSYFRTNVDDEDEERIEVHEPICKIYKLSFFEKIEWLSIKKKFELMVGYHWTYSSEKRGTFYYRKPIWLYQFLFKLYYRKNGKSK